MWSPRRTGVHVVFFLLYLKSKGTIRFCLIEQVEAHVFFLFFDNLFLLGLFGTAGVAAAATATAAAAAAAAAAANVGDQLFNRFGLQEFGKQVRPVRFDGDTSALDDRVELVFGDFLAVIVQDEGRVSACKFSRL